MPRATPAVPATTRVRRRGWTTADRHLGFGAVPAMSVGRPGMTDTSESVRFRPPNRPRGSSCGPCRGWSGISARCRSRCGSWWAARWGWQSRVVVGLGGLPVGLFAVRSFPDSVAVSWRRRWPLAAGVCEGRLRRLLAGGAGLRDGLGLATGLGWMSYGLTPNPSVGAAALPPGHTEPCRPPAVPTRASRHLRPGTPGAAPAKSAPGSARFRRCPCSTRAWRRFGIGMDPAVPCADPGEAGTSGSVGWALSRPGAPQPAE
jgi:hypothetical protein